MNPLDHRKSIIGARRRNNIFGEVSDYILSTFLSLGGDGVIYNPDDNSLISLVGRSNSKLYFINLKYQETAEESNDSIDINSEFIALAQSVGAEPLLAVARSYSKKCKFYRASGSKVVTLL